MGDWYTAVHSERSAFWIYLAVKRIKLFLKKVCANDPEVGLE